MEDVVDLSSVEDLQLRSIDLLSSADMDMRTRWSILKADLAQTMSFGHKPDAFFCWLMEIVAWMMCKSVEDKQDLERSVPVERDDRVIYAALQAASKSFEVVINQLLHEQSERRQFSVKKPIKSLRRRVLASFDLFCENFSIKKSYDAINLKKSILNAAELAKAYISFRTNQIECPLDEEIGNFGDEILSHLQTGLIGNLSGEVISSNMQHPVESLEEDMVGRSGDFMKIKERLMEALPRLDIIPIVGMGGIGKTTLTQRVYEDPQIKIHFQIRGWCTVSQKYHERNVLLNLLQSIAPLTGEELNEDEGELAIRLKKRLMGWRYLIVIDDIWDTKVWDQMMLWFPKNNTRSRIILTSRITEVASYASLDNPPHFMDFLDLEQSWKLLRKQVFAKGACPPELVDVGQQIVKKCLGLPLAIKVVGGHLSNITKTRDCWQNVAEKVDVSEEVTKMDSLFKILSLSYSDLPRHLKACFLSMATFPKNSEIPTKKLIKFWTATGFLHPQLSNSTEDETMKYFDNLMSRSLIIARKKTCDGKVKSCGVHDLLWDMGMREARKEGTYIFGNTSYFEPSDDMKYIMELSRSLLYFENCFESDCLLNFAGFKLLRVLDILNQFFDHFPDEITELVGLRYLGLSTSSNIPQSVSKLCNLETLINNHENAGAILPEEIWLLAHLRHLHIGSFTWLPEESATVEGISAAVVSDLQTLSTLSSACCTKEIFSKIPNLKELAICQCKVDDTEDELSHGESEEKDTEDELSHGEVKKMTQKMSSFLVLCAI